MNQLFLDVAKQAVMAAQDVTMQYFGSYIRTTIKQEDSRHDAYHQKSPVTIADQAAERCIKEIIRAHFPDHGFLGEEEGEENEHAAYKRIIDPIDGTRNFARGLPYRGILLALSYKEDIIVAVVAIPVLQELYRTSKGGGTRKNNQRCHVSDRPLAESYLGHSRYSYIHQQNYTDQFHDILTHVAYTKSYISRESVYVATGGLDGVLCFGGNYYDNAPFVLLIEEAGGKTSDLYGATYTRTSSGFCATNGTIHDELIKKIQTSRKKD